MEDHLNIKWISKNLLLLGNCKQRLEPDQTGAQMIFYLVQQFKVFKKYSFILLDYSHLLESATKWKDSNL